MRIPKGLATYWDTSGIIPLFFEEEQTKQVREIFRCCPIRILSSLGYSELRAVLSKKILAGDMVGAAAQSMLEHVTSDAWLFSVEHPTAAFFPAVDEVGGLRGADLWHLALFKKLATTQFRSGKIRLVAFDRDLLAAASRYVGAEFLF